MANSTPSAPDSGTPFELLLAKARTIRAREKKLSTFACEKPREEAMPGEIWTLKFERPDEEHDLWCLILDRTDFKHISVLRAIPLFTDTVFANHEDALLPSDLLGFESAFAFGCALSTTPASLDTLVTSLPEDWTDRFRAFDKYVRGVSTRPTGIHSGIPYLDSRDSRIAFHTELLEEFFKIQTTLGESAFVESIHNQPHETLTAAAEAAVTIGPFDWDDAPAALAAAGGIRRKQTFSEDYQVENTGYSLNLKASSDSDQLRITVWDSNGHPSSQMDGSALVDLEGKILGTLEHSGCKLEKESFVKADRKFALRDINGRFWILRKKST